MESAAEALRQVAEGADFASPRGLLKSIKAETAVIVPAGAPYSIATNVKHADIWQQAWLNRLRGEPLPKIIMGRTSVPVSIAIRLILLCSDARKRYPSHAREDRKL